jgi:hypothetical protein
VYQRADVEKWVASAFTVVRRDDRIQYRKSQLGRAADEHAETK